MRPRAPATWNPITLIGLASLILLWAWQLNVTWGAWGNLSIDSGHEMYIPALLAEGKTLYRDVYFMYGPASPYFNSYLFRAFGIHLNVLYWAGSLAALGSAIFLYLIGMRLSAWAAGWAAGAVQIAEAFHHSLFCFPLPYTFASVYGCLLGCIFLWTAIVTSQSTRWFWMFTSATLAAIAFLVKPEFGIAAYATLGLLIAVRGVQSRGATIARDVLAVLPGLAICALVVSWMVSIGGVDFMTQENIVAWPTSYFMQHFGRMWLERNGFTLDAHSIQGAAIRALLPAGILLVGYCLLKWNRRRQAIYWILAAAMTAGLLVWYVQVQSLSALDIVAALVFPTDMVLYVALATVIAWLGFLRQPAANRDLPVLILLSFSSLLAFRILMKMRAEGYSIYYNGPVILAYFLLVRELLVRSIRWDEVRRLGQVMICVVPALMIVAAVGHFRPATNLVPLITRRGTLRVSRELRNNYLDAIAFMKEKAAEGEYVLSVPEDTSLYFLSETYCPTRVFLFIPGIPAPGPMMTKTIAEIEGHRVRYLLWSNRNFEEFGVPIFGTDFDRELGDYFRSHYHHISKLPGTGDWRADIWERNQ
jgi:hypothetical protein